MRLDVVKQLIAQGVDLTVRDTELGQTILHKVSHLGNSALVGLMLEKYTGINKLNFINCKDNKGGSSNFMILSFY